MQCFSLTHEKISFWHFSQVSSFILVSLIGKRLITINDFSILLPMLFVEKWKDGKYWSDLHINKKESAGLRSNQMKNHRLSIVTRYSFSSFNHFPYKIRCLSEIDYDLKNQLKSLIKINRKDHKTRFSFAFLFCITLSLKTLSWVEGFTFA